MVGGAKIKSVSSTSSFVHAVHAQFWSATIPLSVRELAEAFLGRNCAPISVQRYTWGSNSRRYQLTKSDKLKTWLDVVICWILHRWVWLFSSQGIGILSEGGQTDTAGQVCCASKNLYPRWIWSPVARGEGKPRSLRWFQNSLGVGWLHWWTDQSGGALEVENNGAGGTMWMENIIINEHIVSYCNFQNKAVLLETSSLQHEIAKSI